MIKIGNPSHWHQENGAGQQPLTRVAKIVALASRTELDNASRYRPDPMVQPLPQP
jgi:hypothetical protein